MKKPALNRSLERTHRGMAWSALSALCSLAVLTGCAKGDTDLPNSSSSSEGGADGEGGTDGQGSTGTQGGVGGQNGAGGQGGVGGGQGGAGGQGGSGGQGGAVGEGGAGGQGGGFTPPVGTAEYPAETEQNNIQASADLLADGTKGFTASLYPLGDIDFFSVLATPAGSSLKIDISDGKGGCPPGGNLFLRVFGPGGLILNQKGYCPSIDPLFTPELAALSEATYYVQVESASLTQIDAYQIDLELQTPSCGDGVLQIGAGEQCDDGNVVSGDGCSDVCAIEVICGDSNIHVIAGEQCDDGNAAAGDGCSDACQIEGKSYLTETEPNNAGDSPNSLAGYDGAVGAIIPGNDQDTFSFDVTVPGSSVYIEVSDGNGGCPGSFDSQIYLLDAAKNEIASDDEGGVDHCSLLSPTTTPDAANLAAGTYTVLVEEYDNNAAQPFYILDVLVIPPGCGDLVVSQGEQCDDGNTVSGDGCSDTCQVEYGCGDSIVHAVVGEQCDDGNATAGDGCSDTCTIEGKNFLNETEPNPKASPNSITGYDGAVGAILPKGDTDFFKVDVTAPGSNIYIAVTDGFGGCPEFDSLVTLYDQASMEVTQDDESGVVSCSLISPLLNPAATNLPAGTYTIMVEEYSGNEIQEYYVLEVIVGPPGCGDFLLAASEQCDDGNKIDGDGCSSTCELELSLVSEVEPNGTDATATSLAGYEGAYGSIEPIGDQDYYSFDVVVPGSSVTLAISNGLDGCPEGFDSNIYLYNQSAMQLATDDDNGVEHCSLITPTTHPGAANLPVGTYTIKVEERYNDEEQPTYVLEVKVSPQGCGDGLQQPGEGCDDGNPNAGDGCDALCQVEAPWEIEPNSSQAEATVPWPGYTIWRGAITPEGDRDWFVFNYVGGSSLSLTTHNVGSPGTCDFDTFIHLVDINGQKIVGNDDDGPGSCSRLSSADDSELASLPDGTYFVWVQSYNDSEPIPAYELSLSIQ